MRIVCPKCVAQYEVDDSAIPETGREVQCANCNHIWFQDRIEMLPTRPKEAEPGEPEIFEDLEGVRETQFHSARAEPELEDEAEDDDLRNILAETDDEDEAGAEEDPGEVDADAAFARARDELDRAAAAALDGGLDAERDAAAPELPRADAQEPEEILPEPEGDPLADMEAFSADFDTAEAEAVRLETLVEEVEAPPYEPIIPPDDPVETLGETRADTGADSGADAEAEDEDDAFEEAPRERKAWRADGLGADDASVGDFELADRLASELSEGEDTPLEEEDIRNAWFGGVDAEQDDHEDDAPDAPEGESDAPGEEEAGDEVDALMARIAAASGAAEAGRPEEEVEAGAREPEPASAELPPEVAALGLRRPKARGVRSRPDAAAALSRPGRPEPGQKTVRPARADARPRLPDVDEVSEKLQPPPPDPAQLERNPLRSGAAALREDAGDEGSSAFRRAFIWTLFFVALLMALYVFRPQIVELLPAAAAVLDPYAEIVDQLRVRIDGFVAALLGG